MVQSDDPRRRFDLGQPVRHRDHVNRLGYVVAMLLCSPYMVLVHWRTGESTFEPLDMLVEIVERLL
jgi:hypothetical protein